MDSVIVSESFVKNGFGFLGPWKGCEFRENAVICVKFVNLKNMNSTEVTQFKF